jgi:hypothetical protein
MDLYSFGYSNPAVLSGVLSYKYDGLRKNTVQKIEYFYSCLVCKACVALLYKTSKMKNTSNTKTYNGNFYTNPKNLFIHGIGHSQKVNYNIAMTFKRTGKSHRVYNKWATVWEVVIEGELCELTWYDTGKAEITYGSSF